MAKQHTYTLNLEWQGNTGVGTRTYTSYERAFVVQIPSKPPLYGSSDVSFRGDTTRYNPEEMLLAALSSCHMLWYLHLCSASGIVVLAYADSPQGYMQETDDGGGYFTQVVLRPQVTIQAGASHTQARLLHHQARQKCFIANSVNFDVLHEPSIEIAGV